jgi:hypothetical protein
MHVAYEWLRSLENCEWPRGRKIALRQARVLRKIIARYEEWFAKQPMPY